jgi:acid stress-induced BolA-like protein IbaG/YrbA
MIANVKRIIAKTFPRSKVHLSKQDGQIGGSLVWDGFDGMAQIDRQVKLRNAINSLPNSEDRHKVSFILTMTPLEEEAIAADKKRLRISPSRRTA